MNPVALYFASGDSLYAGAGLLLIAIFISRYLERGWRMRTRNLVAWLAVALLVMACPPFSWIVDAVFLGTFALWLAVANRWLAWRRVEWRVLLDVLLLVLLLTFTALELSHRQMPAIVGLPSDHLVVIGDSISSGIDPRALPWPTVMQQLTNIQVKNLSRVGARAIDGLDMAEKVTPEDHVVLIEIGGNDLLGDTPSSVFDQNLNATLSRLTMPGRTLVMFELPLLPNRIAYGQIQRRLAARYGVWLIPKRYFAEILGSANATSDGLHLSESGARRMASLVARTLSPVLTIGN